jgi:hypothetical protein
MLHVYVACTCCMSFACICCMSMRAACPFYKSMLGDLWHALYSCKWCMSMLHVLAQCPYWSPCFLSMLYVYFLDSTGHCYVFMLHVHVACFCCTVCTVHWACPCCILMLCVHFAFLCCVSQRHVLASCPCCMSMLHFHTAYPFTYPYCIAMLGVQSAWDKGFDMQDLPTVNNGFYIHLLESFNFWYLNPLHDI